MAIFERFYFNNIRVKKFEKSKKITTLNYLKVAISLGWAGLVGFEHTHARVKVFEVWCSLLLFVYV